jgi:DNA polymerase (family 10)
LRVANGLSVKELHKKIKEVKKVDKKMSGIKVLCGTEVDILSNGEIDYPDSVLKELDFVIAAIHSGFKQSREQTTKRIISACKNKYVNIIAHPTGILAGVRDAYDIDLEEVLGAAHDYKVALEINCHPQRLDLNDISAMKAKAAKVKLFLGTDAHDISQFEFIDLGVNIARRGWLEKSNILNCMDVSTLLKWLKK